VVIHRVRSARDNLVIPATTASLSAPEVSPACWPACDPREHQLPERLIARGGLAEAEHVISTAQGIQQVPIRDEVI
jgi:hypothetical protein